VDDLDPIFVMKLDRAPLAAAYDCAIQFDSDSLCGKIELGD
jgi:hypothetical protein